MNVRKSAAAKTVPHTAQRQRKQQVREKQAPGKIRTMCRAKKRAHKSEIPVSRLLPPPIPTKVIPVSQDQ
jgi:hypothetical protein